MRDIWWSKGTMSILCSILLYLNPNPSIHLFYLGQSCDEFKLQFLNTWNTPWMQQQSITGHFAHTHSHQGQDHVFGKCKETRGIHRHGKNVQNSTKVIQAQDGSRNTTGSVRQEQYLLLHPVTLGNWIWLLTCFLLNLESMSLHQCHVCIK